MATVKRKPAAKKAAPKKAATKSAAAVAKEAPAEAAPDPGVTMDQVEAAIASAIGKATENIIAAVTAQSPQVVPDAPAIEGDDNLPDMERIADIELLELTDPIAAQLAKQDHPSPGGQVIEAEQDVRNLSRDEYLALTDEEKRAYDNAQAQKIATRKKAAAARRADIAQMGAADRIRTLTGKRDPDVIRKADNPGNERMVKAEALRKIGLGEEGTSDLHETIFLPISAARHLQDEGCIKVLI